MLTQEVTQPLHTTTDRRTRIAPFLSNLGREKLEELLSVTTKEAISRCNKRNEIMLIEFTWRFLLAVFGLLVRLQDS
jgi:2-phospho-L-lactate guanylyltransferase (CobY/MobA/RfbA family)